MVQLTTTNQHLLGEVAAQSSQIESRATKFRRYFSAICIVLMSLLSTQSAWSQTYYSMASGNYSQTFTNLSTAYPTNFNGLAILATGAVPAATKTTTATNGTLAAVTTGTAIGYDAVAANSTKMILLTTGATDNSTAVACDLNLDFTGRTAGSLTFDYANILNTAVAAGRASSLIVYYSTDGTNWTSLGGPYTVYNTTGASTANNNVSVTLPTALNNQATVKLRFYAYNGGTVVGTPTGSRPKISLDNISVTSTSSTTPSVTPSVASLTGFNYAFGNGPSASQSFTFTAANLTGAPGNITVTGSTNYQVSTDNITFTSSVNYAYSSATLTTQTVYVRLKSGLASANYNAESITLSGGGLASSVTVTASGTVTTPTITPSTASLTGYTYVEGSGPSTSQSFTFTGSNLTGFPANITVTGSTNYEVSTNNTTFASSVTYAYSSATLTAQTVYVRLKSGLTAGTFNSESITISGGGISPNVTVTASGSVTAPSPVITTSVASLTGFTYFLTQGPSAAQSFTITGANLTAGGGTISLNTTSATDYEISTTSSTTGFASTASLTYTGTGALASNTVWVRLKSGLSIATYNGQTIGISGGGASGSLTLSGSVTALPYMLLSAINVPTTENMNSLGSTATAALPTGVKIGTDWSTGTTATTIAAGTSGTGILTGTNGGGVFNFANGVTASSTDRALGFLTTGAFTSPQSIMVAVLNNTGATVDELVVNFDYEKYRSGSRAFNWNFFHGSTTTATIAATAGDQAYAADANNTVIYDPPTAISKSFSITGISIPSGGVYYLRWTYTGTGGSTNGQATGIDNLSIIPTNATAPQTTLSSTSITGLSYPMGTGPSTESTVTISGSLLTSDVVITPPADYEISTTSGTGFVSAPSTLTLTQSSGNLVGQPVTLYIRLKGGLSVGSYNNETFTITSTGAVTKTITVSGTVAPSLVTLSASTTSASESAGTVVTLTATASGPLATDETVNIAVTGTGITAADYAITDGDAVLAGIQIKIPSGSSTGTITFTIQDDNLNEGTETATITMSGPTSGIGITAPTTAVITISDDDDAIRFTTINTAPSTITFDDLANTGTTNTMSIKGTYMLETGTNANLTYAADNGSGTAGNTYSYGITATTDRALGSLASGSLAPAYYGLKLTNNIGTPINSIDVTYTGEQWRCGGNTSADNLYFEFSTNATSLSTGTWNQFNSLNMVSLINNATASVLDGNLLANRTTLNGVVGLGNIPNGSSVWIRWRDENIGGNDHGMGIDDVILVPKFITPSIFYSKATGDLNDLNTWGDNPDGSGNNPANFTAAGQTFNIVNTSAATLNAAWTVSGATSKVVLGDGVTPVTFTVPAGSAFTGTIDVAANGTLNILESTSAVTFGIINSNSTVAFGATSGTQNVDAVTFGNLTLSGAGVKNITGATTVLGNIILDGASLDKSTLGFVNILYSGNIEIVSACAYTSGFKGNVSFVTSGNASQVVKGNGNDLMCSQFNCLTKTSGSLVLSATGGSTIIRTNDDIKMNLPTGVTFNDNGNDLYVGGDFETAGLNANYTLTGTLHMTGVTTAAVSIRLDGTGGSGVAGVATLNHVIVECTNSNQVNFMPISGASSTITIKGNLTITGTSAYTSGVRFGGATTGNTINIGGNFSNTLSSNVITPGQSTFNFNGTSAQSISSNSTTGESWYKLILANASGLSVGCNLGLSNNLTCSSGIISTSTNTITLGSAATLVETATSYVSGIVKTTRTVTNTSTQSFGNLGLTITASGAAPGSTVVTRTTGVANPIGCISGSVLRTFNVVPTVNTGLNAVVKFGFNSSVELNSLIQSELKLYNVTTPSLISSTITGDTLTANGFNSFTEPITAAVAEPNLFITDPAAVCTPGTVSITGAAVTLGSEPGTKTYWEDASATTSLTSPSAIGTSGIYYIKLTNTSGCSTIQPVNVTINSLPAAPVVSSPVKVCQFDAPADLTSSVTGTNLKWYTLSSGGIGSTTAPSLATNFAFNLDRYVSQTDANGCESPRSLINIINYRRPATPNVVSRTQCSPGLSPATVSTDDAVQTTHNFIWYDDATAGNTVQSDVSNTYLQSVSNNTTLYVTEQSEAWSGCESYRATINMNVIDNNEPVVTNGGNPTCSTTPFTIELDTVINTNDVSIQWYYQPAATYPSTWLTPSTPIFSSNISTGSSIGVANQSQATYYYAALTCLSGGTVSSSNFLIGQKSSFACNYCQPTGSACGGSPKYLRGIKVTSNALSQLMFNSTNNGCNGFGTFSGNSNDGITPLITFYKGYAYTLELVLNSTNSYVAAWLDYGINGDFNQTGENLLTSTFVASGNQVLTLTIPSTFTNVGTCILRIRTSANPIGSACGNIVGEVEDYVVSVQNAPNPINDIISSPAPLPALVVGATPTYITGNNAAATNSSNISGSCFAANSNYKDVWYTVTVPSTGEVYLNVLAGTYADHDMQVWSSSNNQYDGVLTSLGCDDNSGVGNEPYMKVSGTPGQVLFVQIRSHVSGLGGSFLIGASHGVVWRGGTNTDWNTASNWYNGTVPSASSSIVVPAYPTSINYPTLPTASATTLKSIYLQPGAVVTINSNVTFTGNIEKFGTGTTYSRIKGTGFLMATGATSSINSDVYVENFSTESGSVVTVNPTSGVLSITGLYNPNAGTINTNNNLIIRSVNTGTGLNFIGTGQLMAGAGTINGDVVIERRMPYTTTYAQHYISIPTTNNLTVSQNFSDDFSVVGSPYPWQYTGAATATVWPNTWWYNASLTSFSPAYRWMNGSGITCDPGRGISVNLAGLKVIDVKGTPQSASTVTVSTTPSAGNLVGNPYPSTVDLNDFISDNITNIGGSTVYYNNLGTTVSYSNLAGGTSVPDVYGDHRERFVGHSTSFWVNAISSSVEFNANQREYKPQDIIPGAASGGTFYAAATPSANPNFLRLRLKNGSDIFDETLLAKESSSENGFDRADGTKYMVDMDQTKPYIYSVVDGQNMVINAMPQLEGEIIPLGVVTPSAGAWTIATHNSDAFISETASVILEDRAANKFYNLKNMPEVTVDLPEGNAGNRFFLHIGNSTTGIKSISKHGVKVYSNHTNLTVDFGSELKGATSLEVVNLQGQVIMSVDASNLKGIQQFDMSQVADGTYVVKVVNAGNAITEKVSLMK